LAEVVGLPFAACAYEKVGGGHATSEPDLFVGVDIAALAAEIFQLSVGMLMLVLTTTWCDPRPENNHPLQSWPDLETRLLQ
jgi:hypothetical protein